MMSLLSFSVAFMHSGHSLRSAPCGKPDTIVVIAAVVQHHSPGYGPCRDGAGTVQVRAGKLQGRPHTEDPHCECGRRDSRPSLFRVLEPRGTVHLALCAPRHESPRPSLPLLPPAFPSLIVPLFLPEMFLHEFENGWGNTKPVSLAKSQRTTCVESSSLHVCKTYLTSLCLSDTRMIAGESDVK